MGSRTATTRGAVHGNDPALLRRINAATITRLLYEHGVHTLSQVMASTGLSRRTTEGVLRDLGEAGLVVQQEINTGARVVGRPPRGFEFRGRAGYCIGLEVGRSSVSAMVSDLCGQRVAVMHLPIDRRAGRSERIAAIIDCARRALAEGRVRRRDLWAAGVGTPGLVLPDGSVTVCTTLPEWQGFNLADALRVWLRCPVTVENDVNAGARAEHWRGAGVGLDTMAWVWVLRTGNIKSSLIWQNQLYRGADGAAGEVGALAKLIKSPASNDSEPVTDPVEAQARALGPRLAALVMIVNPPLLVLGGALAGTGSDLAGTGSGLAGAVRDQLRSLCHAVPEIRLSTLGPESGTLGAIRIALDHVQDRLFDIA